MMTAPHARSRDFVQALANGLDVLRAFGSASDEKTMAEIARITGQTRASIRRAVLTLAELGYLERKGRHLRLTSKVDELSGKK
jgi:IclR family transcriptional regulator, pca regulon regulatory protein